MFSKLTIYIAIILVVLFLAYITGKKSVHNEILIKATPEQVWIVLINANDYSLWNPVMRVLKGELKEGNTIQYKFIQDDANSYKIASVVKKIMPNKLLNQKGGIPMFFTFNHKYILAPSSEGTKLIIHEDYQGIGVHFWNPKPVGKAYERLNKALKKYIEYLN